MQRWTSTVDPCAPLGGGLSLKGPTTLALGNPPQTLDTVSEGFSVEGYNAVYVQVFVSGTTPSGVLTVEGASEQGGQYIALADPQATKTVTAPLSFDVVCGTRWARIRLASVSGTFGPGEGFVVWVTPYVSPGQPNVTADHIGAGQTAYNTGVGWWMEYNAGLPRLSIGDPAGAHVLWDGSTLEVAGAISALSGSIAGLLTIGPAGSIEALGAGLAKAKIDATGIKLYDSGGIQRAELLNDGSGWLGNSTVFNWSAAGVVSLNGSAVMPNTIVGGKTNWFNVPIIDGLVLTNNSPVAGSVAWGQFTLTYQGTSYTVAAGNTANKFIWWNRATSTTVLQTAATPPVQAPDQFIVAFNEAGTAVASLFSNIVYADYILANTLSAIQANTGSLTVSGGLTVGASGNIHSGQTAFNTGTGFWLEYNGGIPRFSLGTPGGPGMLWDGADMTVWGAIGATSGYLGNLAITGVISLLGGGIYQGTGTFASPTTGLKLWNDSGIGRLAGYSGGTIQAYFGSDGKLYAGAGNAILDTDGVTIAGAGALRTSIAGTPYLSIWQFSATDTAYSIKGVSSAAKHHFSTNTGVGFPGSVLYDCAILGFDGSAGYVISNYFQAGFILSAQSGAVRLPNSQWITARNVTNSADVNALYVDSSNRVQLLEGRMILDSNGAILNGALSLGIDGSSVSLYVPSGSLGIKLMNVVAHKHLRVSGGALQVVNSAYSAVLWNLTDTGAVSNSGAFACNGANAQTRQSSGGQLGGVITALINVGILSD